MTPPIFLQSVSSKSSNDCARMLSIARPTVSALLNTLITTETHGEFIDDSAQMSLLDSVAAWGSRPPVVSRIELILSAARHTHVVMDRELWQPLPVVNRG